jgi:hypothetical protein
MITIQKVTCNVQSVPRQSPDIYWHAELCSVIPNFNYVITVGDWNCLKYCVFACFCTVIVKCTETFWSPCSCWLILPVEHQSSCSFLFHDLSYNNYILNVPSKCTNTIEYFYCLLNICYMFRRSLRPSSGRTLHRFTMKSEEILKSQEEIPISTEGVFVLRYPVLSIIWQLPGRMCILHRINSLNHCGNCTYQLDWTLSTLRRYDGGLYEGYSMMIYETGSDVGLQRVEWLWRLSFRKHLYFALFIEHLCDFWKHRPSVTAQLLAEDV